jgi:hypothetical protein
MAATATQHSRVKNVATAIQAIGSLIAFLGLAVMSHDVGYTVKAQCGTRYI